MRIEPRTVEIKMVRVCAHCGRDIEGSGNLLWDDRLVCDECIALDLTSADDDENY